MIGFLAVSDFPSILDIINKGGLIAILIFIIWAGYKKEPIWVFGWAYREEIERHKKTEQEKENWKELALRGTRIAETAVSVSKESGDS